ncbi:30S ribosomal protein S6e [Acidianus sulfidivorans JP7]|uniref:Small ribosomal subunit protein eS6 n=1 Tax=Acidianus sulfidivorans JP7 TaxID=619593 RepID=A0A2U9IMD1_9CREN|nr:30S ribosomal protein S6e [Acidianus sulfidivorans]AWR97170.1 30S ribosomal protein S6e [Acidianus sulfidivorans JP7]
MPDFKIVISDPQTKNPKQEKVHVKADESIQSIEGEKDRKALPIAKINTKLKESLGLDNLITLQIEKQEGDKKNKIKVTFLIQVDNSIPENEAHISKGASEKFGAEDFEAIAYRTKAFQISVDQAKLNLFGVKIGETINLTISGVNFKLKITGGSDNTGFPMRADISGLAKRKVLLSSPPGYHPKEEGERKRKIVRGDTLSNEIVQVNTIISR